MGVWVDGEESWSLLGYVLYPLGKLYTVTRPPTEADHPARIDGGPEGTYMGYAENRTLNQLLYYTAGLSKDREHVLVSVHLSTCQPAVASVVKCVRRGMNAC